MAKIPAKVQDRFKKNLKYYSKILESAKDRDINESDTVDIISDILADILGFDKYLEITREYAIKGTYCDLAIKNGSEVRYLIECKAIGTKLNESHLRQVRDYAASKGVDLTILTNGVKWQVYKFRGCPR